MTGEFSVVTRHPAFDGSGAIVEDTVKRPLLPRSVEVVAFHIGDDSEMMPGQWQMRIEYRGQILAQQSFLLTR